jgi:tRNA-specific 2-thiouridylase
MRKDNEDKRIVVGMSGGVDSSMVLILLKKMGYQPIGVSLKYCV